MEQNTKQIASAAPTEVAGAEKTNQEEYEYTLQAPLFIKFAEYLGYVSEVLEWCDEWCEGNEPAEWKKKFIEIDARQIYNEMIKDMSRDEIKNYYESFYEVILFEWDEKLIEMEKNKN
jgi:hypothetical protein